jgi:hypothetical protein
MNHLIHVLLRREYFLKTPTLKYPYVSHEYMAGCPLDDTTTGLPLPISLLAI